MLGAPSYAQTPTLRGEIGSSTMENRRRGNQLKYLKYVEENLSKDLLRRIAEEKLNIPQDCWIQTNNEFKKNKGLRFDGNENTKFTWKKNKDLDTENWKEEIVERSSHSRLKLYNMVERSCLKLYNKVKEKINEEKFYDINSSP